jgi:hypothetical protein
MSWLSDVCVWNVCDDCDCDQYDCDCYGHLLPLLLSYDLRRYCDDYDYEEDYYDCIATTATRRLYYYCDDYHDGADDYKFNYDYRPLLLS